MGHHNIAFRGDPHSLHGAWSPPTSRANFCEEDYAISFYIAEFINSVTNLSYVWLALRTVYGTDAKGRRGQWDFMSATLLILGIGSFLFHASLRQVFEFVDELSMMLLAWAMLQAMLTTLQTPQRSRIISVVLAVFFVSFSVFYVISGRIIYQVIAFLASMALLVSRSLYLRYFERDAFPLERVGNWNVRAWQACGISCLGYGLWNIDLEFCAQLRALRDTVGLPWAWLFELHGWWHILTAIGAAQFMDVAREMRAELKRPELEREKKEE